ncbi:hypothetical protein ACT3R7_11690 [Halomonas sp. AOP43-A1-21]
MAKIRHDAEAFDSEIYWRIYKEKLIDGINVITRDGEPETLLVVVRSLEDHDLHYSNGKTYKKYQHAFAALGAAIDRVNPEHNPLDDQFAK